MATVLIGHGSPPVRCREAHLQTDQVDPIDDIILYVCSTRHLLLACFDLLLLNVPRLRLRLCLGLLLPLLLPLAVPIPKQIEPLPHHNRVLDELLHAIDKAVPVATRQQPATAEQALGTRAAVCLVGFSELRVRHGHGALIRDGEHAHPAAQDAQRVDRVEALAATADLRDSEGASLRRPDGPRTQRNPVDLVFEHGRHLAVLLGGDPDVPVGPSGEVAQLLHFCVGMVDVVFDRETRGVVDADVGAQTVQDARCFVRQELRIRSIFCFVFFGLFLAHSFSCSKGGIAIAVF